MNARHSSLVIMRCGCESPIDRPEYCCGPPAAQQTISVAKKFEPLRRHPMVCFIHPRIGIQARIDHDSIN